MDFCRSDIVGATIEALLQTPERNVGTWIEEIGDAYWIDFVITLTNGIIFQLGEYDLYRCEVSTSFLVPASLPIPGGPYPDRFSKADFEGREVVFVGGDEPGQIFVFLESGLGLGCSGGPGGNSIDVVEWQVIPHLDYFSGFGRKCGA